MDSGGVAILINKVTGETVKVDRYWIIFDNLIRFCFRQTHSGRDRQTDRIMTKMIRIYLRNKTEEGSLQVTNCILFCREIISKVCA